MNGYNTAIAPSLEQMAFSYTETEGRHTSQSELVQDIARDFSETNKIQEGLMSEATFVTAEGISISSEKILDIADLFPKRLPKPQEARYAFFVLQEWEGYVVSISENTFTARLVDITRGCSEEQEEADFLLDDLEDVDRARIRRGAIFRWTIGYRRGPAGTKERSSRIAFRNLPAWTKKELERNRQEAAEWSSDLTE